MNSSKKVITPVDRSACASSDSNSLKPIQEKDFKDLVQESLTN
jgi:hypothetical protein